MSRTFFRKFLPAVPRAAGRLSPSGPKPFAATSSVLYAPPARRGRETLPHTGCRQLQRGKAEGDGGFRAGGEPPNWRFAPVRMLGRPAIPTLRLGPYMEPPRRPGAVRLGPPGHSIQLDVFDYLYISRRIGLTFRPGVLSRSSCERRLPCCWSFLIRLRQTSHEANTSRDCFRQPRARRKAPSCNRP